ncbi:sodium transporter HKT1-like [Diospyros lotus]|uniref:sodium transporter HKT1-like n=1 Tax=Diospyros lotus TaxID=55363 RepID=UPI00224E8C1A|nr:sodium transporter HKT1-like [Diospyros lotus]
MANFAWFGNKLQHLCSCLCLKLACFGRSIFNLLVCFYRHFLFSMKSFTIHVVYFVSLSFLGFLILKVLKPRTESFEPRNLDLLFTSVSASTVSSMSTVEMEVFSNTQLIVLTVLMFIGGEVFTSMVGLHLGRIKFRRFGRNSSSANSSNLGTSSSSQDKIELGITGGPDNDFHTKFETLDHHTDEHLRYRSIKFLGFVVLGYLLVINGVGIAFVFGYLKLVSSAGNVLKTKGLKSLTFSVFTVVSTFASCGFVPTNENMVVFSKNSGLLLMLIPQVLVGNTLFPPCLRFSIWVLGKFVKNKAEESDYLLKNTGEVGYLHLLPNLHSSLLVVTVGGFILVQFILFCSLEWESAAFSGMNTYQKIVGVLFETVNSRHSGETILDISTIAPAILVLFIVMMYLPPYTSFLPKKENDEINYGLGQDDVNANTKSKKRISSRRKVAVLENLILSQLSYLVIIIILICITERTKMRDDPLNFNVLNVVLEVISAYGNVGFTTGYSCKRQLKVDENCKDKWYGFSGWWSDKGKLILILVMFLGRFKKFNMQGGQAWKLF